MRCIRWPTVEIPQIPSSKTPKSSLLWSVFLTTLVVVAGCGDDSAPTGPGIAASINIAQQSVTVEEGKFVQLLAVVKDGAGNVLADPEVVWSSSDVGVAAVNQTGLVSAIQPGSAMITATCEAGSDSVPVLVTQIPPPFVKYVIVRPDAPTIAVGQRVQLTATLRADGGEELTGREVEWSSDYEPWATVDNQGVVLGVGEGVVIITATSEGKSGISQVFVTPEFDVVGPYTTVAAAMGGHQCALTGDGDAHCWGHNQNGELGAGYMGLGTYLGEPGVRVVGGHTFVQLVAGNNHTCGLTPQGAAYCWGSNSEGQFGTGDTVSIAEPVAAASGLRFLQLGAGEYHTCGVTVDNDAYCWGRGVFGALGCGHPVEDWHSHLAPTAVVGGLKFSSVSGGVLHNCGLTLGGAAYCWGLNANRQLGDGATESSSQPVAVAGGLTFTSVSAGGWHSCGQTDGTVYCWGNASSTLLLEPTPVTGLVQFASMDAGKTRTGGVGKDGYAYYWMANRPLEALPLLGNFKFDMSSGGRCGVTPLGAVYCWGGAWEWPQLQRSP